MSSLKNAFNSVLFLTGFDVTWERPGSATTHVIKISSSNYSRNKEGPEEMTMTGREFVIPFTQIEGKTLVNLKKGDRLVDERATGFGVNMIEDIEPLKGLKGEIIGYRVRTS